jgi:hypothetical protein
MRLIRRDYCVESVLVIYISYFTQDTPIQQCLAE